MMVRALVLYNKRYTHSKTGVVGLAAIVCICGHTAYEGCDTTQQPIEDTYMTVFHTPFYDCEHCGVRIYRHYDRLKQRIAKAYQQGKTSIDYDDSSL